MDQLDPSIAALPDGCFVVTWTSYGQDGSGYGIYGQRFDASGSPLGSEFLINTSTYGPQYQPSITGLPDGGFAVTWLGEVSGFGFAFGELGICGQRYDAKGTALGSEFQVHSPRWWDDPYEPSISTLADGGFVVTWWSKDHLDLSRWGIYGQRFDASGSPLGSEFKISDTPFGYHPSITGLPDGGFAVTWYSDFPAGHYIYGQRFDASSSALGQFRVNTTTLGAQSDPSIAALPDGGFVVTWTSTGQDGNGYGIYGQRFDASSSPLGSEFLINTTTSSDQSDPSVTALPDGGFVVTWTSIGQDGSAGGIFGRIYPPLNHAPVLALPLADASVPEDTAWSFQIPAAAFTDVDATNLTYAVTLGDGSALPKWLIFDAETRTVSGTPSLNFNGALDLKVTASDGALTASDVFTLAVTPVNDAPVLATALSNASVREDTAWSFSIPAGAFTDVDSAGLTYSVTLSDGSALPRWITFDPLSRTFSGMPQDGDAGTLSILVTGTDPSGLSASDTFDLVVSDNPGRLIAGTAKADLINASFNKGQGTTSGEDKVNAGNGNDQVYGLDGSDQVYGGNGDDKLYGQQGRDRLYGEDGNDLLDGGIGEDILTGGLGNDTMIGGAASDTFVFLLSGKSKKSETDLIMDFSTDDRIDADPSTTVTVVGTSTDATGDGVADTCTCPTHALSFAISGKPHSLRAALEHLRAVRTWGPMSAARSSTTASP
jgi:hypothetical protein